MSAAQRLAELELAAIATLELAEGDSNDAEIEGLQGFRDDALELVRELVSAGQIELTEQWGYAHAESAHAIYPDGHRRNWFETREAAERAMQNDLRWRLPTFIVSRHVSEWSNA